MTARLTPLKSPPEPAQQAVRCLRVFQCCGRGARLPAGHAAAGPAKDDALREAGGARSRLRFAGQIVQRARDGNACRIWCGPAASWTRACRLSRRSARFGQWASGEGCRLLWSQARFVGCPGGNAGAGLSLIAAHRAGSACLLVKLLACRAISASRRGGGLPLHRAKWKRPTLISASAVNQGLVGISRES